MSTPPFAAVLFTVQLEAIAHFYEQVVGMHAHSKESTHIVLTKDNFRFTVHQIPEAYAKDIVIRVPPLLLEDSAIKLCFPVANLGIARQIAAQHGGCVYGTDREWTDEKIRVCDGWDPDGNIFQLMHYLE